MRQKKNQKKRIMVVEDEEAIRGLLETVLKESGYNPVLADNVDLALKKIHQGDLPDLILLDLIMPKKDGTELLKALKRDCLAERIPVILISASHKVKGVAGEYKIKSYLEKPFDIGDLQESIKKLIN